MWERGGSIWLLHGFYSCCELDNRHVHCPQIASEAAKNSRIVACLVLLSGVHCAHFDTIGAMQV
jgi:hypothetical protein